MLRLLEDKIATPLGPLWVIADEQFSLRAVEWEEHSNRMEELLERFDQMTKPQLPTNWLMRLTTKRYLRAYPHLQGTHHASLKKEEKKAEEKK